MKKIFFILIVLAGSLPVKAQSLSDLARISAPQIIPPSPQSWTFEKFVNHTINEYAGTPDIQIPLYEIEIKGMKIPIVLTYDASGIKYKQFDGEVGAGWSLNIGGYRVYRTIHGKPDEKVPFYDLSIYNSQKGDNWKRDTYLAHVSLEYSEITNVINAYPNQNWICDGQYDQFTYNLPTTSGHFLITDRNARTVDIMEQNQDKVYINQGNTPFHNMRITDSSGNNYFFSTSGQAEKVMIGENNAESAWVMNRITSVLGDAVNFSYKEILARTRLGQYMSIEEASLTTPFTEGQNPNEAKTSFNGGRPSGVEDTNFNAYYIDEISTDKEIVKVYRRGDYMAKHIIEKIIVTNKFTNQPLRTIVFKNNSTVSPHRLLDGIEITGSDLASPQKYQFGYHIWNQNIENTYPDQWGYYNFSGGSNFVKPVFHDEFENINYLDRVETAYNNYTSLQEKKLTQIPSASWFPRSQNNLGQNYFSLKKITYPTGGCSEYEYEPNQSSARIGIGWRVKKITSMANDNNKTITIFKYGEKEDGKGKETLSSVPLQGLNSLLGFFINNHISLNAPTGSNGYVSYNVYRNIKTILESPTSVEVSTAKVYYSHVTRYEYNESQNKYNGKTVSVYSVPSLYSFGGYSSKPVMLKASKGRYDNRVGDLEISRYYIGCHPVIIEKVYFDDNGKKMRHDTYGYIGKIKEYEGIKVKQFVSWNGSSGAPIGKYPVNVYDNTNSLFSSMGYKIESRPQFLSYKKNIQYTYQNNFLKDSLVHEENYTYNLQNQLINTTQTNSTGGSLVNSYKYPQDYSAIPYTEMVSRNMISPIIEQVSTHNNKEISRIKTNYSNINGLILPSFVQTSASGLGNLRTDITYNTYDTKGNIRQITTIDGISTVYLWSYNGQYPIAEIKNTTFAEAETAAKTVFSVAGVDALSALTTPNEAKLKDGSLQKALPNAHVTTYTYKPLVGILTATDPAWLTTTYEYDTFGRLIRIKDPAGKIIQSYNYHYQNQ